MGETEQDDEAGEEPDESESAPEGESDGEVEGEEEEPALLPDGNPVRARGLIPLFAGLLVAFVLMALGPQYRFGVPIGILAVLTASFGVLDLLGTFDDPDDKLASSVAFGKLLAPIAIACSGVAALWAFVTLAVDGRLQVPNHVSLPSWLSFLHRGEVFAALLVPAAFLLLVVGLYRVFEALGVFAPKDGEAPRPLHRRHGFWLLVVATAVLLPLLGSHSLSDPWETHYGEVSREILSRNDWISLWWVQDGWFFSKPILDFWIQAMAMAIFGVRYGPDRMLSAVAEGRIPWPEWAVRLPIFLMSVAAVYLLYKAVAKIFGRRAGLLGGLALIAMPQFFLVVHQTMTDMPFVAALCGAMALVLLGLHTSRDEEVKSYEVDFGRFTLRFSLYHAVIGGILVCAIPQILYLFSRNLEIDLSPFDIRAHFDAFAAGSPGNCGMPSQEQCHAAFPSMRGLQPSLQALIWTQALALVVYMNWGERRRQRLYYLGAWLLCTISWMAKGPAGIGLPVIATFIYLVAAKRWKDLFDFEVAGGTLIVLGIGMPWFVAMFARHGQGFTDRLFFHDMFKRAFTHQHDTNEGDDVSFRYYVWQLGYALFPLVGVVPAALLRFMKRKDDDPRGLALLFLSTWFLVSFALFSLMLTKFHHYILPAVPAVAMLVGIYLDDLLPEKLFTELPAFDTKEGATNEVGFQAIERRTLLIAGVVVGAIVGLLGVGLFVRPFTQADFRAHLPSGFDAVGYVLAKTALGLGVVVVGLGLAIGTAKVVAKNERVAERDEAIPFPLRFDRAMTGAAALGGAFLVFLVGRDLSETHEGLYSQVRLFHLFTYNYKRPWPPSVDLGPAFWAFTVGLAIVTALLVVPRWRRHVVPALLGGALAFAAWGVDVYMMRTSPHWGQRETTIAYYEAARTEPGPLVAYQMNWKGENFYTGNHVNVFVSSGKRFTDWMQEQKRRGQKVFYFVTEHGRVDSLKNELGTPKTFEKLTTPELDNKFLITRATFD